MKIRRWLKPWWVRFILIALAAILLPYAYSRIASPWRSLVLQSSSIHPITPTQSPEKFRICAYNIAHGRGLAKSNWEGGDAVERKNRLDEIIELLREINADVVVLNEVDFDSSWSFSVNQAAYLATQAGYPYRAEQRNLDLRVLGWKWRFGNAILSKHPISNADVIDTPGYATWETILAGKKRALACDVSFHDQTIRVVGVHLSSRSETVRTASAKMLVELTKNSPIPVVLAGDFNSTPTSFSSASNQASKRNAIETIDASGLLQRYPMQLPGPEGLTFHSSKPRSVIDWIFIPQDAQFQNYNVELSRLSDHRPVHTDILFRLWQP